jgi:hypothetical protein
MPNWLRDFPQDLQYAARLLRKSPGFAATAVLTLALGIGANTTLFSVVNGVLLNPLPYPHSEQLVAVYGKTPGFDQGPAVYLNFLDWQRDTQTFSSMAMYRNQNYNVTGTAEAERLSGYMISADFFSTLGVQPILGRAFRSDDDQVGAAPVVMLGGGLWRRKFGSSPDVIGKSLTLNGASYIVVGVIPSGFTFYGHDRDVYTPIGQWNDPSFRDRRISVSAHVVGRLKPGVTLLQAKADMDVAARNLAAAFPAADKETGITLVSMKEDIVGNVQPFLLVLLAAVGFLLLIACTNVANLLLARHPPTSRRKRFARGPGRIAWAPVGLWRRQSNAEHFARHIAARRGNLPGWTRIAVHAGPLAVRRNCFRSRSRAQRITRKCDGDPQGKRPWVDRRAPPPAKHFRNDRSRHGLGSPDRRGADAAQPLCAVARQSRIQSQPRHHLQFIDAVLLRNHLRGDSCPPAPVRR